jgi:hypothetical protein
MILFELAIRDMKEKTLEKGTLLVPPFIDFQGVRVVFQNILLNMPFPKYVKKII